MANGGVYSSFTLSDDAAIESIITGIPLFCVGIFSIGVFTFLLSLKRVDLLSVYLFISSFFGFIAAIVDLGQILIRGYANAVNGTGFGGVAGFIRAREVLLSLSIGTLFVFFWTFVGQRPIGIPPSKLSASAKMATGVKLAHCGSWSRWGFVGLALKWASLLICILIGILQIVWRVAPKHHRYADLYVTSGTLETTISAIFILKIFLNFYLTPADHHRQVLLGHIVPVLALLVNGGLGVGNLVLFSFSETTLGRFLRAIEVYTLIVYFLIVTFRVPREVSKHKPTSSIDKTPLPIFEKTEGAGTYDLRNPSVAASPEPGLNSNILRPWNKSRNSAFSKVSSWLSFEPFTSRIQGASGSRERDPETALSSSQDKISMMSSSASEPSLLFRTTPEVGWIEKPKATNPPQETSDLLKPPVPAPFLSPGEEDNRPLTDISLSYYAMENDIRSFKSSVIQDSSSIGSDSPVYGLDGIIPPRRRKPAIESIIVQPPTTSNTAPSENLSPIEELLQQQSELDRSISALRGLHDRQNSKAFKPNADTMVEEAGSQVLTIPARRETMTPNSNGVSKPSSTSGHSDSFSLSVFPDPPAVETPELSARNTLRPELARARVGLIPLRIPGVDIASAPSTPSQIGVTAKFDSAVTQYDVTSFIGDLTGPNSGFGMSGNAIATSSFYKSALSLSDDDNADGDSVTAPASDKSISPTSTVRAGNPPSSATSTTPPAGRGLGKATMSSTYKAKRPQNQKVNQAAQAAAMVPAPTEAPPSGAGPGRVVPPTGLRRARSGSLNRTQTGADRAMPTTRF